jgi:hypothetical protein
MERSRKNESAEISVVLSISIAMIGTIKAIEKISRYVFRGQLCES